MSSAIRQRHQVQIRWMIRRDMSSVLEIENQAFGIPWCEEDFLVCLRKRNCIGMVAEDLNERICGYMIYELEKYSMHVVNFAVDTKIHRQGVGTAMVNKLVSKLSQQRRQSISLEVRESNVDAQLFFRRMGFRAVGTFREHYEDTNEDAYQFVRELPECDSER